MKSVNLHTKKIDYDIVVKFHFSDICILDKSERLTLSETELVRGQMFENIGEKCFI